MSQNKCFNPGRFVRLFRNDLIINKKTYLFAIAGLSLAVYALISFFMLSEKQRFSAISDYTPSLAIYIVVIWLVAGTSFPAFQNQIKTSNYLLSPGSSFEKFLVQFVIRILLFIPLALFIYWVGAHLARASMVADPVTGFDPFFIPEFSFSGSFNHLITWEILAIVFSIFSVTTLFFAGSVYFKRFTLFKTLVVLVVIYGAVFSTFVLLSHIFYPHETSGFNIALKSYNVDAVWTNMQYFFVILGGLSWLFFLLLAYFKLKEREV